ncbi:MAG: type II toxin-antitoxin system Phd/YefM family antitoxin [Alphaproteobacteria bacterium]
MSTEKMHKMTTGDARAHFAEVINRSAYGQETIVLTRRGKALAAVVPIEDLELLRQVKMSANTNAGTPELPEESPLWQELGNFVPSSAFKA